MGLIAGRWLLLFVSLAAGLRGVCQVTAVYTVPVSVAELPDGPEMQSAEVIQAASPATGSVHGVVMDRDGAVCEGATVQLMQAGAAPRTITSDNNGQFQFSGVAAGTFQLTVSSRGFGTQTITGVVRPDEDYDAKAVVLDATSTTNVRVTASQVEIAQEQLKIEETQRVLWALRRESNRRRTTSAATVRERRATPSVMGPATRME
jgi:hypothetical protein